MYIRQHKQVHKYTRLHRNSNRCSTCLYTQEHIQTGTRHSHREIKLSTSRFKFPQCWAESGEFVWSSSNKIWGEFQSFSIRELKKVTPFRGPLEKILKSANRSQKAMKWFRNNDKKPDAIKMKHQICGFPILLDCISPKHSPPFYVCILESARWKQFPEKLVCLAISARSVSKQYRTKVLILESVLGRQHSVCTLFFCSVKTFWDFRGWGS
jgi:hypothetical protein